LSPLAVTDDFKTAVQTVLDRALNGEETANFEFPLMTKAGARIEILLNATTRRDEHGKVIGVVGIGQDITGKWNFFHDSPICFVICTSL
jgi:PAS domain S-box-containing protein